MTGHTAEIYDAMTLPGFQVRTLRQGEKCTVCGKNLFDVWIVTPVPTWNDEGDLRVVPDHWRMQRTSGGVAPLRRTACINAKCVQSIELGTTSFPEEATKYMCAKRDIERSLRAWHYQNPNRRKKRRRKRR